MFFEKMQTRKNDGFTLVELIVVIAILAILAGIAVPAYSGYIEKANVAADEQLLHAVNIAFLSAAAEHADGTVSNASLSYGGSTGAVTVTGVASVTSSGTPDLYALKTAFATYYGENNTAAFKTVTSLMYDSAKHMFVNPATAGSVTLTYAGNQITVSGEAIQAFQKSTFGTKIGGEDLLAEVANLTAMVGTGDIDLDALLDDDAYMRSFAAYLGYKDAATADMEDVNSAIDSLTADWSSDDVDNALVNGLVYYAAEGTKNMTSTEVSSFLTSGNIYGNLSSNQSTKLAQASMAYGMYTAFVNSEYYTGETTSTGSDPMAAIQTISGTGKYSAEFDKYIKSDEGKADIKAYMAAMNVINDSTGNAATGEVLKNGFDDPELITLLTQAIGK